MNVRKSPARVEAEKLKMWESLRLSACCVINSHLLFLHDIPEQGVRCAPAALLQGADR